MKIFNALAFNLIWFGCILYGNVFVPVVILLIITHLVLVNTWREELKLILLVSAIGISVDSFLVNINFFIFPQSNVIIPIWLIAIWCAFAATINHSLAFLKNYGWAQFVSGAIAAPLSYLGGVKLNAVNLGFSLPLSLMVLSATWLVLMPTFIYLSKRPDLRLSHD